jgi:hypothetical protein
LRGARVVRDQVLNNLSRGKFKTYIVWTPVLFGDRRAAAEESLREVPDPRVTHFWDNDKALGKKFGRILELPHGKKFAWDVYLLYDARAYWGDHPPEPNDWMHQLGQDARRLDGETLRRKVAALLEQ